MTEDYCRFLRINLNDLVAVESKNTLPPTPIVSTYTSDPTRNVRCQRLYVDLSIVNGVLHDDVIPKNFDFVNEIVVLSGHSAEGMFEYYSGSVNITRYPTPDNKLWNMSFLPVSTIRGHTRFNLNFGENVSKVRVFGGRFDESIRLPENLIFDIGGTKFYVTDGVISRLGELDSRYHNAINRDGVLHFF